MNVVPGVTSLKEGHGYAVSGVVFSGTPSLVAQLDLSGWLRDGVFFIPPRVGV